MTFEHQPKAELFLEQDIFADPQNLDELLGHTNGPVVYRHGDLLPNNPLHRAVTGLRTLLVTSHHWLDLAPGELDHDHYDDDPGTLYLATGLGLNSDGVVDINACMRLTRIHNTDDILSVHMWDESDEKADFYNSLAEHADVLEQAAQSGRLFDLTRLTTRIEADPTMLGDSLKDIAKYIQDAKTDCFALIGAGIAHTMAPEEVSGPEQEIDQPTIWMFTMSASVKKMITANGIKFETVYQGKTSATDPHNATLAYCIMRKQCIDSIYDTANMPAATIMRDAAVNNLHIKAA